MKDQGIMISFLILRSCSSPFSGHSMGGGIAALVAALLRSETRLLRKVCMTVRAVCFAPAAVVDEGLTTALRSFVTSLVLGDTHWFGNGER